MDRTTRSRRAIIDLARVLLRRRNQFLHGIDFKHIGVGREDQWYAPGAADRRKILGGIVGKLLVVKRRIESIGASIAKEQRISGSRAARDRRRSNHGTRGWAGFDQDA